MERPHSFMFPLMGPETDCGQRGPGALEQGILTEALNVCVPVCVSVSVSVSVCSADLCVSL